MRITIVGRHCYQDVSLRPRQRVFFEREPTNPHDENAIAVFTMNGEKIGHVRRQAAQLKLCSDTTRIFLNRCL